jgi:hypothetical protein
MVLIFSCSIEPSRLGPGHEYTKPFATLAKAHKTRQLTHECHLPVICAPPAPVPVKQLWVVRYKYVQDILERRGPYRPAHLAAAKAASEKGILVLGERWGTCC